jgi:Domain of unknown function (DUF4180)
MQVESNDLHGVRVLECAAEGALLRNDRDIADLIALAWEKRAKLIVLPVVRLGDEFFHLKTRIAGGIVQKFVNYELRLAIMGDISKYVGASSAFRDFVAEANRGRHLWLVSDIGELSQRLERAA